jgi:membrane-associated phospholipid phosphatase
MTARDIAVIAAWFVADSRLTAGVVWPVVRPWLALALVPLAYWHADTLALSPPHGLYERDWMALDVRVLGTWHLQSVVESAGLIMPVLLETIYASVYLVPAVILAIVQARGTARSIEVFLQTFLLGTLTAYALLPFFPSSSPRLAFADVLPPRDSAVRHLNIWILQHLDIGVSVFPSGHVTAAWATALGAFRAVPERRMVVLCCAIFAAMTAVATVYGRYHYVADAVAGIAVACATAGAWGAWKMATGPKR